MKRPFPPLARFAAALLALVPGLMPAPAAAQAASAAKAETPKPPKPPGRLVTIDLPSKFVAARKVHVWLPAEYDARPAQRFPVLYMHDGQNLFDPGSSYAGEWGMDEAVTRLAARGDLRATIVVGIANTGARAREYLPAKWVARLPEDLRTAVIDANGGAPLSDAYLSFLVREVKPAIDRGYRTLPGPGDTSIMGSSMGGLISLYAIGEYPQVFGQAAALSTHWILAVPDRMGRLPAGLPSAVATAFRDWMKASAIQPGRNRLYMDRGTAALDALYELSQTSVDALMPGLGWKRDADWESRVFTGAAHTEQAWRERIDVPLVFLDRR